MYGNKTLITDQGFTVLGGKFKGHISPAHPQPLTKKSKCPAQQAGHLLFCFSAILLFRNQPEAVAVYIYYFYRAVFFKVFAQLGYVYIHATTIKVSVAAPYAL